MGFAVGASEVETLRIFPDAEAKIASGASTICGRCLVFPVVYRLARSSVGVASFIVVKPFFASINSLSFPKVVLAHSLPQPSRNCRSITIAIRFAIDHCLALERLVKSGSQQKRPCMTLSYDAHLSRPFPTYVKDSLVGELRFAMPDYP